jgi:hypothetical protein
LQRQKEIERGQAAKRDSERYLRENRLKSLQLQADVARWVNYVDVLLSC